MTASTCCTRHFFCTVPLKPGVCSRFELASFQALKTPRSNQQIGQCSSRWHLDGISTLLSLWSSECFCSSVPMKRVPLSQLCKSPHLSSIPWDIWRTISVSFCLITLTIIEELGASAFSDQLFTLLFACCDSFTHMDQFPSPTAKYLGAWKHLEFFYEHWSNTGIPRILILEWHRKCVL